MMFWWRVSRFGCIPRRGSNAAQWQWCSSSCLTPLSSTHTSLCWNPCFRQDLSCSSHAAVSQPSSHSLEFHYAHQSLAKACCAPSFVLGSGGKGIPVPTSAIRIFHLPEASMLVCWGATECSAPFSALKCKNKWPKNIPKIPSVTPRSEAFTNCLLPVGYLPVSRGLLLSNCLSCFGWIYSSPTFVPHFLSVHMPLLLRRNN